MLIEGNFTAKPHNERE